MSTLTTLVHFSPQGSTYKIGNELVHGLGFPLNESIDLTDPKLAPKNITRNQMAIFTVPVYSGRIPALAAERIKKLRGDSTPCVLLAVYGNRDFDDALLELYGLVKEQGFEPIGAGAFIAEHTFSHQIGTNRPDLSDLEQVTLFAKKVLKQFEDKKILAKENLPGNIPYKEASKAPIVPLVKDSCVACGLCAQKCPAEAIPESNYKETILEKCILCARCIQICPTKSRFLPQPFLDKVQEMLTKTATERKEPEFFF